MLVYPRDKNWNEVKHLHPSIIANPSKLISNIRKLVNRHKNHCPECGSSNLVGCGCGYVNSHATWYEHCDHCGHDFDGGNL